MSEYMVVEYKNNSRNLEHVVSDDKLFEILQNAFENDKSVVVYRIDKCVLDLS